MLRYKTKSERIFRSSHGLSVFIMTVIVITFISFLSYAQDAKQKSFKSPEDAFKALVQAAGNNDIEELSAIFGPEGKDIISSGDAVADRRARERFVKTAGDAVKFSKLDDETMLPVIGKDECPFPIPIVKSGQAWVFSTEEGKQEIINRRIGRNELNTIQVAMAYVDAQREYARKDRNGDGVLQYAQHFVSHKGKKRRPLLGGRTRRGEESPRATVCPCHGRRIHFREKGREAFAILWVLFQDPEKSGQ